MVYYHTISLTGLSPSTTYYYHVKSKNSGNQTGVSAVNVFATAAVTANDVIVESRTSSGGETPNPPYSDFGFLDSAGKSTAAGLSGSGSRYATGGSGTPSCTFKPTLPVAGGTYDVYTYPHQLQRLQRLSRVREPERLLRAAGNHRRLRFGGRQRMGVGGTADPELRGLRCRR